ncbi:potassium-transporting ATPase subunit KdpA, partial [Streptomyces microflavus]|uniref:potassium-transporting ATPase subunit KdpA n=1 Tax=Streptomyces microflavus TaxID=1919 RepID=UPI0033BF0703
MSSQIAGLLQLIALIVALALAYRPLGDYMARVYSSEKYYKPEKWIYKVIGADPAAEMRWPAYLRGVLAFSAVSVLFLYLMQRVQGSLPGSLGFSSIDPDQAFNTAASFVANTNWQSYYGEQAMGHVVQTGGLAVQNFLSAAVGMAVAVALVRGFARSRTGELGNFWTVRSDGLPGREKTVEISRHRHRIAVLVLRPACRRPLLGRHRPAREPAR